jgi:hypothetical protein
MSNTAVEVAAVQLNFIEVVNMFGAILGLAAPVIGDAIGGVADKILGGDDKGKSEAEGKEDSMNFWEMAASLAPGDFDLGGILPGDDEGKDDGGGKLFGLL